MSSLSSLSFAPLFKIVWKLGLALAAFKCGHYLISQFHRVQPSLPPSAPDAPAEKEKSELQAEVDTSKLTIMQLAERLQHERERAQEEIDWLIAEAGFWRRMENLARKELQNSEATISSSSDEAKLQVHADQLGQLESRLSTLASAMQERQLSQTRQEAANAAQRNGHYQDLRNVGTRLETLIPTAEYREKLHAQQKAQMQALLDKQQTQLSDAMRYLSPSDTRLETDVLQMVRALNLDVSRAATSLTESFHAEEERPVGDEVADAFERTTTAIGPIMAELLESTDHHEDPILVQVALQADLAGFAAGIISAWDFQHQSNATFAGIHKQMLKTESQNVAGRWRALTRRYSKERLYNGRDLVPGFVHQLAERMSDIMVIAGARTTAESVLEVARQKLESVVRLSLEIQQIIGEEITSCDLEIMLVRLDEVFDPTTMEDVYGAQDFDEGAEALPHVLCTSHLGLRRCERPQEERGEAFRLTTMLRPKVVLETFVYELGLVDEGAEITEE